MRTARIKETGPAYYHLVSRIVDRRRVLDANEKERFRRTMRAVETFCGVQILTYAILDNHFHILLHVPERTAVDDGLFLRRLACLYDEALVKTMAAELAARRAEGLHEAAEKLKDGFTYRMYELSEFVKTLKQRISQSYNRRSERRGTLWEGRFKSVLIEGRPDALGMVAAYIDLNAVRAGIVADPKDYRFCGYGEAVAGGQSARAGLVAVVGQGTEAWREVGAEYRRRLYCRGEARGLSPEGRPTRPGFDPAAVAVVLESNGKLPVHDLLRCRVRYFTDGLVLGGRDFVDGVFHRYRSRFSPKRTSGARPMRGGFPDLFTARRLRLDVIAAPAG